MSLFSLFFLFFFNDTATTEIYTLSLHDALPISQPSGAAQNPAARFPERAREVLRPLRRVYARSEEHTSELQSRRDLVCRLLLEKKKKKKNTKHAHLDKHKILRIQQCTTHRN